jgi:type IV pilus assembly protein PilC
VAIIITLILLTQVIPQFATLFSQTHVKLPAITQLVLHLSQLLQEQGLLIFFCSGLLFGSLIIGYKRSLKMRSILHQGLLKLPFFGGLLQKTIIAGFCQTFSIMTTARIPLPDTLNMLANTCGNLIFQRQIHLIREQIINGQSFHKALQTATWFPPLIVQLVAVGEETGELATMLGQAAHFYEQSVDTTVEQLNTLLEPFIMIMLGILIGGLIIAMYLPIFKIGQLV